MKLQRRIPAALRRSFAASLLAISAALATALAAACGPSAPNAQPPSAGTSAAASPASGAKPGGKAPDDHHAGGPIDFDALPPNDVCYRNKPPPNEYFGLLARVRCDQEMFLTMSLVADQLGVQCRHCHVPHPTDPKKEEYFKPTPTKDIANWMGSHMMKAVKTADGSPLKCASCHTDLETGKPVAKILGNPRDPVKAQEWMSMVMVNKFVTAKGEKLKCKSCHVDNFSKPGFKGKVLLRTQQIPPH